MTAVDTRAAKRAAARDEARVAAAARDARPSKWGLAILGGLSARRSGQVYEGTASEMDVAARRAKNRQARKSRRVNRRRAA